MEAFPERALSHLGANEYPHISHNKAIHILNALQLMVRLLPHISLNFVPFKFNTSLFIYKSSIYCSYFHIFTLTQIGYWHCKILFVFFVLF